MHGPIRWPDGKDFAFTLFDDCDYQAAANVRGVYDFLTEIGLRDEDGLDGPRQREAGRESHWRRDVRQRGLLEVGSRAANAGSRSLYTTSAITPRRGSGRCAAWRDSANGLVMTRIAWRTTQVATKAFTGATPG